MEFVINFFFYFFNGFFFIFAVSLIITYFIIALISAVELNHYLKKNRNFNYRKILQFENLPSVSIIAPAYNEEKSIIENVRCLISLQYPDFEVIIINDGSKDKTLELLIEHFELVKVNKAYIQHIPTKEVKGIYKSKNVAFDNLVVIDKENGGKGDALNVGINFSEKKLVMAIDVDCIIEEDAILRMVKPFLEEENNYRIIATGGVVRVANSCEIERGRIIKVNYPTNYFAKYQVLEYFRAFILGRMAWSRLNGLLIISGAFGMFDREIALKAGGYDTTTVGEDLELVIRMRRYMHEVVKQRYKVSFIPDPLCWTEVPSSYKILSRQRNRWTRGAIDSLIKHKDIFFKPKYKLMGMLSYPYWLFFEWLAPIIEFSGLIYFVLLLIVGMVDAKVFIIMLLFVFATAIMYSMWAIFFEAYTFNKYKSNKYLINVILYTFFELILYHPLIVWFSLRGNYDYFIKGNKKNWGVMTRTAFDSKLQNKNV